MTNILPLHTNASRNGKFLPAGEDMGVLSIALQCANGCYKGRGAGKYSNNMCC